MTFDATFWLFVRVACPSSVARARVVCLPCDGKLVEVRLGMGSFVVLDNEPFLLSLMDPVVT